MKLPLQITFRNMKASPLVEEWIAAEAAKLETFYDRLMACRVAVEIPHRHHRKGDEYHIRIDLTLPGTEIVIRRQANLRNRATREGEPQFTKHLEIENPHQSLRLAIDDAFKAAGRRLQDYARRQRGDTKTHEPLPMARVGKLFPDKGYGFLTTPDAREIYFRRDSVLNRAFPRLKIGSTVRFVEELGEKGPQASTVRIVARRRVPESSRRATLSAA